MNIRDEMAPLVAAGAALLDEIEPDWAEEVNFETLRMNTCERCVAGQVMTARWVRHATLRHYRSSHGFDLPDDTYDACRGDVDHLDQAWGVLEDLWLDELNARRPRAMDIGKPKRTITVEPVQNPVPQRKETPAPAPQKAPAAPERKREKVPA